MIHGTRTLSSAAPMAAGSPDGRGASDLRFFLTAYAGGLAFFLAILL